MKPPTLSQLRAGMAPKIPQHMSNSVCPPLTDTQRAASAYVAENWHDGLRFAGADSNYTGFHAFCAGAAHAQSAIAATPDLLAALRECVQALELCHDLDPTRGTVSDARVTRAHHIRNGLAAIAAATVTGK